MQYYGNTFAGGYVPLAKRWLLPARTGVSTGLPDPRQVLFFGHASFVDSGAPVLTDDGRAIGLIQTVGQAKQGPYAGVVTAPRLDHLVAGAEAALGLKLSLVTAPTN